MSYFKFIKLKKLNLIHFVRFDEKKNYNNSVRYGSMRFEHKIYIKFKLKKNFRMLRSVFDETRTQKK